MNQGPLCAPFLAVFPLGNVWPPNVCEVWEQMGEAAACAPFPMVAPMSACPLPTASVIP